MKRRFLISSFLILTTLNIWAYDTANSFRQPLDPGGWYLAQDFCVWNSGFGGYHLGEDYCVGSCSYGGTELPVYAPANGIVKDNTNHTDYGRVVVIEHRLPDSTYVCSVHGHMRAAGIIAIGTEVSKGDLIGYLSADYNENGGYWFTHLHFGIRNGAYQPWVYFGYASNCNNWYDPTDFIESHQGSDCCLCP